MSRVTKARFTAMLAPVLMFAVSGTSSGKDKADSKTAKRYESPKAVFEAYREAYNHRDDSKYFSLLTPETQNGAVFEAFFECAMVGRETVPITSKYVDEAAIENDYEKQYKAKHHIDFAKAYAGHEHDPKFVPPPHDGQLFCDAVAAHVKDKAGFYDAVAKYFKERAAKHHDEPPICPLGDLEELTVQGDTATAHAKVTILPNVAGGETPIKPGESPAIYDKPFKFRRVNGGWLLDSL